MSKKNVFPQEGADRHNGKQHPPVEKVVHAKNDSSAQKEALALRKRTTGQTK